MTCPSPDDSLRSKRSLGGDSERFGKPADFQLGVESNCFTGLKAKTLVYERLKPGQPTRIR